LSLVDWSSAGAPKKLVAVPARAAHAGEQGGGGRARVGGGNGDARRVNFQGVVGRTPSLWLFTRAETHAAYLVCTIVQNDAR
jgi:hypothetical protein